MLLLYQPARYQLPGTKSYLSRRIVITHRFVVVGVLSSLLLSSSTRTIYPQRLSGQAVVTGAFPSPSRRIPLFLSRTGFSIPTFQLFKLVDFHRFFANSLSRFPLVIFFSQEKEEPLSMNRTYFRIDSIVVLRKNPYEHEYGRI